MRSVALLFAVLGLAPIGAGAQEALGSVSVELGGPRSVSILSAGGPRTRIEVEVGAAELRRLEVPVAGPTRPGDVRPTPRFEDPEGNEAPLLDEASVTWGEPWASLPHGLRTRALPPVGRVLPEAGPLSLAVLAAAVLLAVGLRRRPPVALLFGTGAAACLFVLPAPEAEAVAVRVLEGDARDGRWLEVRGAQGRLELPVGRLGWLRRSPPAADAHLRVHEEGGSPRWSWVAPGARVYALTETGRPVPTRVDPGAVGFRRAWTRSAAGAWSAHGPWPPGSALPAPSEAGGPPPGWLAAGLPQGLGTLVGELDDPAGDPAWLRLVGFE